MTDLIPFLWTEFGHFGEEDRIPDTCLIATNITPNTDASGSQCLAKNR